MFTSSSDSNYIQDEHDDFDQFDPYKMISKIMPFYSYPASLVNKNEIPVDLSYLRAHLAVIMS